MSDLDRAAVLDAMEAYQNVTAVAACRAARACGHAAVTTQGHVLTVPGFAATQAVEAAVQFA